MKFYRNLICTALLSMASTLSFANDGTTFNGADPYKNIGLCNDAKVVATNFFINSKKEKIGKLELKWSEKCGANWALITSNQLDTGNISEKRVKGIVSVSVHDVQDKSRWYEYRRKAWTYTHYNPSSSPMIAGKNKQIFAKGTLHDTHTGETVHAQTAPM